MMIEYFDVPFDVLSSNLNVDFDVDYYAIDYADYDFDFAVPEIVVEVQLQQPLEEVSY